MIKNATPKQISQIREMWRIHPTMMRHQIQGVVELDSYKDGENLLEYFVEQGIATKKILVYHANCEEGREAPIASFDKMPEQPNFICPACEIEINFDQVYIFDKKERVQFFSDILPKGQKYQISDRVHSHSSCYMVASAYQIGDETFYTLIDSIHGFQPLFVVQQKHIFPCTCENNVPDQK